MFVFILSAHVWIALSRCVQYWVDQKEKEMQIVEEKERNVLPN